MNISTLYRRKYELDVTMDLFCDRLYIMCYIKVVKVYSNKSIPEARVCTSAQHMFRVSKHSSYI